MTARTRLTPEDEAEIVRLTQAGVPQIRILQRFRISTSRFHAICDRHDVVPYLSPRGRPGETGVRSTSEDEAWVAPYRRAAAMLERREQLRREQEGAGA